MRELFFVPFDYDVLLAGRRGRPGRMFLRRTETSIKIPTMRSSDLPVAYRIKAPHDLGPGWHLIRRHDGRLWWPLADRTPLRQLKPARQFLHDLRAGRCDLFVRKPLGHLYVESERRRPIVRNGYDDALTAVRRNAAHLLIADVAANAPAVPGRRSSGTLRFSCPRAMPQQGVCYLPTGKTPGLTLEPDEIVRLVSTPGGVG